MKKAIWLISGGELQYIAAKKIIEMGFALIISDRNQDAVCAPLADFFLPLDTFDVASHISACNEVQYKFDIKAVMTFAADCHYTVASVAKHLRLHGIDPEISKICFDKAKTRKLLKTAGIYQPESYMVQSYQEAVKILAQHPHKSFVLKATDNSASRGFQILTNNTLSEAQFTYTQSYSKSGNVLLEERLIPDPKQISEVSVETLWVDGKMYWINWVDRIFASDLKFFPMINMAFPLRSGIEIGHINPAKHEYKIKQSIAQLIQKAGYALDMHQQKGSHILKADIFFSTQGPVILELTPRCSGGWDSSASSPARAADIAGGIIHIALGKSVSLTDWYQYFHYHDAERTVAVLCSIPENAVDCMDRKYGLASGYAETSELIKMALKQLKEGKYVSI